MHGTYVAFSQNSEFLSNLLQFLLYVCGAYVTTNVVIYGKLYSSGSSPVFLAFNIGQVGLESALFSSNEHEAKTIN